MKSFDPLIRKHLASIALVSCGIIMSLIFHLAFASRYNLAQHRYQPRQSIATLNHFSTSGALIYIVAFLSLFAIYGLGYRLGIQTTRLSAQSLKRRILLIILTFAGLFNAILLPMYPVDGADIYDYIIRGRMSAVYGLNPLKDVPVQIKRDPFYNWAAWEHTPSAYGPAWELLAEVSSRIAGNDYMTNVFVFKGLAVAGYSIVILFLGLLLWHVAPRRMLGGVYLFAWNPLVVYMSAGTGHNDALMTGFILISLYFLIRQWYIGSVLVALLGALVKFIPILLLPIIVVVAFKKLQGWRRFRFILLSALIGSILMIAMYTPFWHGWETLRLERRELMFTGSVATVLRQVLIPILDNAPIDALPRQTPVSNALLANVTLVLMAAFMLFELVRLWRNRDILMPVRISATILLFYLLVASMWFHAWYVIWIMGLAALLDNTPLRRLILIFSYLVTWQAFLYNYINLRPTRGPLLPWLDLVPVVLYMGFAYAYAIRFWLDYWIRYAHRSPLSLQLGEKLRHARETAQVSISDLSDELGLRADDLLGYEQGVRSIPLNHLEMLSQRLEVSLGELLAFEPKA